MLNRTHPWIEVGNDLLLDLYTGAQVELMLHDPENPTRITGSSSTAVRPA